jgi:ASCH domain
MKALSIKQPWANLIAAGEKTIETRTWATNYRGPILIVSSKTPKIEPAGFALAIADLADCRPMTRLDEPAARCSVYPNAHSWVLRNIRKIHPYPVRGKLGLYDIKIPLG